MAHDGGALMGHVADVGDEFGHDVGQKKGIEVWRIENKKVVAWPEDKYGQFCTGDSYIILHTVEERRKYDLFFWLGEESSIDEKGIAAYKTVDLDAHLKDVPVQYRECQGAESQRFIALWKKRGGLRFVEGGVDSGFTHVSAGEGVATRSKLYKVKGKRSVRVDEVKRERASLNDGDVFILETNKAIYLWEGKEANRWERVKGAEVANHIREQDHEGKIPMVRLSEGGDAAPFWAELGGEGPVAPAQDDDDAYEKTSAAAVRLFKLAENDKWEQVQGAKSPLSREALLSGSVMLVDSGNRQTGLFMWVGKDAPINQKRGAMIHVNDFLKDQSMNQSTPAVRMDEGSESTVFKSYFKQPFDPRVPYSFGEEARGHVATMRKSRVNMKRITLERSSFNEAHSHLHTVDHGGEVTIWRINNFAKELIDKAQHGQFYDGDSYIIQHVWKEPNGKQHVMIYFWQGSDSSVDETAASAMLAHQLNVDEFAGNATEVRLTMGKEDESFLVLFGGKMIIHHGGVESGFHHHGPIAEGAPPEPANRLYHVRGSGPENAHVVQVPCEAANLNSNDAFVLLHASGTYLWLGKGASEQEMGIARQAALTMPGGKMEGMVDINEGEETDEFWALLGGKAEYVSDPATLSPLYEPRLFQISNASGAMDFEEIFYFGQEDLVDEDIMLLDTVQHVYLWVGLESNAEERKEAPGIAKQYLEEVAAADGRDPNSAAIIVQAGHEPPIFTCHFMHWDQEKSKVIVRKETAMLEEEKQQKELRKKASSSYLDFRSNDPELIRKQHAAEAAAKAAENPEADTPVTLGYADPATKSYDLSALQGSGNRPKDVDPAHKEMYLSAAQFQELFGVSKEAFTKLAAWKQKNEKVKHGLF